MTTIRTLLHKDFRHFLPHRLAVVTLLLVYFFCLPLLERPQSELLRMLLVLSPISLVATWLIFIPFMVHDAAPTGTTEFWMTRPISGTQLFACKFIILAVYFALLPSLAVIVSRALGLMPPDTATLAAFFSIFSGFLVLMLCLFLLASLTHNTAQFVFCIIIIVACFCVYSLLSMTDRPSPRITILQNPKLFEWLAKGVAIAGLSAIIWHQYVRRNARVTVVATTLLALLLVGILRLWPAIQKI